MNTYISSSGLVSEEYPQGIRPEDKLLIVSYPRTYLEESEKLVQRISHMSQINPEEITETPWKKYEVNSIFANRNFIAYHETSEEMLYTFDLSKYESDWNSFLKGRYSQFNDATKQKIIQYRYEDFTSDARKKMFCYLYPYKNECVIEFARELDMDIEELKLIKELCNKPDFRLENYTCDLCLSEK